MKRFVRRDLFCIVLYGLSAGCGLRERERDGEVEFWAMGREGEVVEEMLATFERDQPGVRVRVQQVPWSAAHEKLLTAYVGNTAPDLFQLGNSWVAEFAAIGALERLDGRIAGSVVDLDDFFDGVLDTNRIDGGLYGVPWYVDTRLLFYRSDLVAEAGYDTAPRSWASWVETMKAIKRGGKERYAIFLPLTEWQPLIVLAFGLDAQLLRDNDRYSNFASEEFRKAFEFYVRLFRDKLAPQAGAGLIANVYQEFARGYFSFYITGPWNIGEFQRRLPAQLRGHWQTAPMPAAERDGVGVSVAGGASLAIFRDSRRKDAAWKLIEYLSAPQQQLEFYALTGDLPARRSAWKIGGLDRDRFTGAFWEQLQKVRSTPKIPEWERIADVMMRHVEGAVRGDVTTDEALSEMTREVDALLEKRRWLLDRKSRRAEHGGITHHERKTIQTTKDADGNPDSHRTLRKSGGHRVLWSGSDGIMPR